MVRTALSRRQVAPVGLPVRGLSAANPAKVEVTTPADTSVTVSQAQRDVLSLLDAATGSDRQRPAATGSDQLDLMVLDSAGPVARERALVGCLVLSESSQGDYAPAQIAATMERLDTAWLRALDLN